MILFHVDLDNTLIYSHKKDLGSEKCCVERYQDQDFSFLTRRSQATLERILAPGPDVQFVPTTTRTVEQYRRICLPTGIPRYALACNGGALLVEGELDEQWYQDSLESVAFCRGELKKAAVLLETDEDRSLEVRCLMDLFLFTRSDRPDQSAQRLRRELDLEKVQVLCHGTKLYVVPGTLHKGQAVRRLREKLGAEAVIAAGDSVFDVPMLREAEYAIAPAQLAKQYALGNCRAVAKEEGVFSDVMLEYALGLMNELAQRA